jgi:glycerol kinase
MEKKFIMAIDQGTTGTRVFFFDHTGAVHSSAYREITQIYPHPGWVEQKPQEYWETTMACAKEAIEKGGISAQEIMAIGITCQRETTILWNRDTGEPLYNAIVWQSRQTADICERLKSRGYESLVKERTGLSIDAYFSASKIRFILDRIPNARELLAKDKLCFGNIDSFLIWKLSGGAAHVEDYSNAARTMLLNIHTLAWDEELLAMLDIPAKILPKTLPSSGVMAMTDPKVFFGQAIPIAGDAGDQSAATFGQVCFKPGNVKNTYGTALAMMMNIGRKPIPSHFGLTTDLLWKLDEAEYAFEGVNFNGGAVIQWLRDGLKIISNSAESTAKALRVPDTGGVYIVPAFTGLCTPYWDMYARGTIAGITRGTTDEHLCRAAIESMAYQTRDVLESMSADAKGEIKSLRVDGGATKSELLMQFQADILGIPLELPEVAEMAALGAAYLAGLGVGFWKDKQEIEKHWRLARRYEPAMKADRREELYAGWKMAVRRSLSNLEMQQ